jgi:hypothetical protein
MSLFSKICRVCPLMAAPDSMPLIVPSSAAR